MPSQQVTAPQQPVSEAWARLRVVTPNGSVVVSLPLASTVGEVVDELVTTLAPGAPLSGTGPWHLQRLGGPPLRPDLPLAAAQPVDGEVLHLLSGDPLPAAVPVDDALTALAAGAASAGLWTGERATAALGAAVVAAGAGAALVALQLGWVPALALAVVAVLAARVLRRDGGDLLALASLPAWACCGLGLAGGGSPLLHVVLTAALTAVGAAACSAAAPAREPWWLGTATAGALVAAAGWLVTSGRLDLVVAAALTAVVLTAAVGALPHLLSRGALWSSDAPGPRTGEQLQASGRRARVRLTALSAGAAVVLATSGVVLVLTGPRSAWVLALVVGAVVALRARRSRFALESTALLLAGAAPFAAALVRAAADGGTQRLLALGAAAVVLAAAVAARSVVLRARAGDGSTAQRLTRPRVRRSLDVAEAVVAVAVVPLLAWVLGVYTAVADAVAAW